MPAWLTTTLLALLLALLSYKLVLRGMVTYWQETQDIAEAKAAAIGEVRPPHRQCLLLSCLALCHHMSQVAIHF